MHPHYTQPKEKEKVVSTNTKVTRDTIVSERRFRDEVTRTLLDFIERADRIQDARCINVLERTIALLYNKEEI